MAAAVAAEPEGGRVMYEGALFRFPAARVSSYASASRKLFPALARGTSVHGLSLSFFLLFLFFLSLAIYNLPNRIQRREHAATLHFQAAFNPARDL